MEVAEAVAEVEVAEAVAEVERRWWWQWRWRPVTCITPCSTGTLEKRVERQGHAKPYPIAMSDSAPHSIHTLVVIDSARNPAAVAAIATTSVRSSPNAPTTIHTSAPCSGGGGGEAEVAAAVAEVVVVVVVVEVAVTRWWGR